MLLLGLGFSRCSSISLIDLPLMCRQNGFIIRVCKEFGIVLAPIAFVIFCRYIYGLCTVRIIYDSGGTLGKGRILHQRKDSGAGNPERTFGAGRQKIIVAKLSLEMHLAAVLRNGSLCEQFASGRT